MKRSNVRSIADALPAHDTELAAMLFDRVPMGVAVLDRQLRVVRYNPTWAGFVARYSPSRAEDLAPGVNLFHLAPGFAQNTRPLFEQVLGGTVVRREGLRLETEGIISCWDVALMPLYEGEKVEAVVLMTTDATERVLAQQVLEMRVEERTRELEQRRRVAEGLRDILAVLNSDRPLGETLDYIAVEAGRLLGTCSVAIFRLRAQEQLLMVQASSELPAEYISDIAIPVGAGIVGRAVAERCPISSSNTGPVFAALAAMSEDEPLHEALRHMADRFHSVLALPLTIKDEIYGGMSLYYEDEREFSHEHIELAAMFRDHAALAIENARLREQVGNAAVAAERNRLARDLHDSVTQTLFSASLIAEVLPKLWEQDPEEGRLRLEELRQLSRGALAEMRMLLLELRPASVTEVRLGELLRQLAEATTGRSRVPVVLDVQRERPLLPDAHVALYRIAQEALNNVARHSRATHAKVRLHFTPERVRLQVSDNGRGFDPGSVAGDHLGLKIMRERAEAIGATTEIRSRIGVGTQVAVEWPGG